MLHGVRRIVFAVAIFCSYFVTGETVFDIDFAKIQEPKRLREKKGSPGKFEGVLPSRVIDHFVGWRDSYVRTKLAGRNLGRKVLQFETKGESGQFLIRDFNPQKGLAYFKLTVCGSTSQAHPVTIGFRLNKAPYRRLKAWNWISDRSGIGIFFAKVENVSEDVGFFFLTPEGTVCLSRMKLEAISRAEYATQIRNGQHLTGDRIRHSRFPFGLPSGWNLTTQSEDVVYPVPREDAAQDKMPCLIIDSPRGRTLYSEPFQLDHEIEKYVVSFVYKSDEELNVQVCTSENQWIGGRNLDPTHEWKKARFSFKPSPTAEAFSVRFAKKKGRFSLDEFHVVPDQGRAFVDGCRVALAPSGGVISFRTRIQFTDETPSMKWFAWNVPSNAVMVVEETDLYGHCKRIAARKVRAGRDGGCFEYAGNRDVEVGQFRLNAWIAIGGKRISPIEEFVMTRIRRPKAWGRDAPQSPFGCHVEPHSQTLSILKAAGVNWVRLHDMGEWCTTWHALEKSRGSWSFHDEEIQRYREKHLCIFGQLGTAPRWASHYGDLTAHGSSYFDNYLRPTNAVDWVNYVTTVVKHYKGVIDMWFVWNEPWGQWWMTGADRKYFKAGQEGADFAELMRLSYDAVKVVDPNMKVCGFSTSFCGSRWTDAVMKSNGRNFCDMLDWHYYAQEMTCKRGEENALATVFSSKGEIGEKAAKNFGKPIIMSEGQGAHMCARSTAWSMSGMYLHTVPWKEDSQKVNVRISDNTCRYVLSVLATGSEKVFLYNCKTDRALVFNHPESFAVLLCGDGFSHPSLAAYSQLTRSIEGRKFVGRKDIGTEGVSYLFADDDSHVEICANLTAKEIRRHFKGTRVADLYGNIWDEKKYVQGTLVYVEGRGRTSR